ncbi:MAG: hypothetical protein M3Q14_03255 [bacterium]|nr:hypothetical protein [bacterium]
MKRLLEQLREDYPIIQFVHGDAFYWSPIGRKVTYDASSQQPGIATWTLLHEVSHGILGHTQYQSDFELVKLEVEAWSQAEKLAKHYDIVINHDHIQDCLDTYRDWLHRRSTCPTCGVISMQKDQKSYQCLNCNTNWQVSSSRFCRPYRRRALAQKNREQVLPGFHLN